MRSYHLVLVLAFLPCLLALEQESQEKSKSSDERDKKVFSLFSIVTFKNTGCKSNQSGRNGTCYTTTECTNKGGTSGGNCAAGFGVCCLFIVSATGQTLGENNSYIQNPGFPSVYAANTQLMYTIKKCSSDICAFRLDFDTFTLLGPADTLETANGHNCQDSFVFASTPTALSTPVICGQGTGQHIYLDVGEAATNTATATFTFGAATSTVRTWDIRVTQIPCYSRIRPPAGCMQYHTGLTGTFKTFNFINAAAPQHLASQRYSICVRQEAGYCCIAYEKCADTFSFTIDIKQTIADMSETDTACTDDYIGIDGLQEVCRPGTNLPVAGKLCGAIFNSSPGNKLELLRLCDCTAPFVVDIRTDATIDGMAPAAILPSRGICFDYTQLPC